MTLKIKAIPKTSPQTGSSGSKKYYAQVIATGIDTTEDLVRRIERSSTMSRADIHGTLYALVDAMKISFEQGRVVQLDQLGNFRISVSSSPTDSPEELNSSQIKNVRIIYNADRELKDWVKNLSFKK